MNSRINYQSSPDVIDLKLDNSIPEVSLLESLLPRLRIGLQRTLR